MEVFVPQIFTEQKVACQQLVVCLAVLCQILYPNPQWSVVSKQRQSSLLKSSNSHLTWEVWTQNLLNTDTQLNVQDIIQYDRVLTFLCGRQRFQILNDHNKEKSYLKEKGLLDGTRLVITLSTSHHCLVFLGELVLLSSTTLSQLTSYPQLPLEQ